MPLSKVFSRASIFALLALLAAGSIPAVLASGTVVVSPTSMNGWTPFQEGTTSSGTFNFVFGPLVPPLGVGSGHMTLAASTDGMSLGLAGNAPTLPTNLDGLPLSSLATLQYSTYEALASSSSVQAISLQFVVAYNLPCSSSCSYQGRIVFEPYLTGATVIKGVWQTWNPMAGAGWWTTAPTVCTQGSPCTMAQLVADFPNIGVNPNPVFGAVILKAGSGWPAGFDGNFDALTIGISDGASTTYDFEPATAAVPEFPLGLIALVAIGIPALIVLKTKHSASSR